MANAPDVSAITTSFVEMGAKIFGKKVNDWNISSPGFLLMKGINKPTALPKIAGAGNIRPYRSNDDSTGNETKYTDRVLTVYQSKKDVKIDPENYRNTYLADHGKSEFYQYILNQETTEYLASIDTNVMGRGVRNGSGSAAADVADGFLTIIDALITATTITPVTTGAITSANAVTKIELVTDAAPAWLKKQGGTVYVSYTVFAYYRIHYRATYGFSFNPDLAGKYKIDGTNFTLEPASWMGTELTVLLTADKNLCVGTDANGVEVHPTKQYNLIETRFMMPIGFQIADLDAIVVNDQY